METVKYFGLAQLLCIANCVAGTILQIINVTYNTNLPIVLMLIFYVL